MKKIPKKYAYISTAIGFFLILSALAYLFLESSKNSLVPYEAFKEKAEQEAVFQTIGTNIELHQVIYGVGKKQYRYKLKTDCPNWPYEDRYVSEKPLAMDEKQAAVETQAASVRIIWDGELLAQGQHFSVPLLGLLSDDKSFEEFKETLLKNAYAQYKQWGKSTNWASPFLLPLFLCTMAGIFILLWIWRGKTYGKKDVHAGRKEKPGKISFISHYQPENGAVLVVAAPLEQKQAVMECMEQARKDYSGKGRFTDVLEEAFYNETLPAVVVGEVLPLELGISGMG